MNLTQIKNAQEGDELKDDDPDGLHLRVRNGRKSFYLYYRNTGTKQRRRPKIGDYPSISLATAREIAREWISEVQRGKDPSADRTALRASETVAELCDRYIAAHGKKASARHDFGRVKNHIKPRWGKRKVSEITTTDIHALRRYMEDVPVAYNRVMAMVSHMWSWAEKAKIQPPKRYEEVKRRRYLDDAERERFLLALDETEEQYPHAIALIRLLYLTGARFSEIAKAKRSQLKIIKTDDGRYGELTLTAHKTAAKTGAKVIILSEDALQVVENVDPRRGALTGFSSGPWDAWELVRKRAKLEDFRLHDLRHSFASDAIGEGFDLAAIGEVLGHKDAATTKRYAHLSETKKRAVVDAVAASRRKL